MPSNGRRMLDCSFFMRNWEQARAILPLPGPRIVVVGLLAGNQILTGKRRDNERWTNPGGHMDEGESLVEAAIREVKEEAGIDVSPEDLELVSAERIISIATGKEFSVFCFIAKVQKEKASARNDPDKEISVWKWVDLQLDSPELAPQVRHARHDSVLCHLGLCRSNGRLSRASSFTEKRLAMGDDDWTVDNKPLLSEVSAQTEGQAIDNLHPDPRRNAR